MNKRLIAVAILGAFAATASAQSTVQIYGSVDGGVRYTTNVDAAGDSLLSFSGKGTNKSNRLGFKGKEDLGNGMDAHFDMESRMMLGDGSQVGVLFNGQANVGIGGAWGSVDLGRVFTPAFKTIVAYDPFHFLYTGIATSISATMGVDDNNAVQYNGTFGPITARAEYAVGQQPGSTQNGSTRALALSYANGPVSFGGAYTQKTSLTGLDTNHYTVGGAYRLGAFRATLGYANQKDRVLLGADTVTKYTWAGLRYHVSPVVSFTGAYYRTNKSQAVAIVDGKKDVYMLGGQYNLSKRTYLYADIDRANLSGNMMTAGQTSQSGFSSGVVKIF